MEPTPTPSSPPPSALPPPPGWWSRNWKWALPVGGCGGCMVTALIAVVFFSSIFLTVFGMMKSSEAYKNAVARAKSDPRVVAALGTPIDEGMFVSGNTNVNGASGQADLSIPISGPKGKATLYVVAEKSAGEWTYSKLVVEVDQTRERIDLESD